MMQKMTSGWRSGLLFGSAAVLSFVLIGFVQKAQEEKVYKDIRVHINNEFDNYFIDEEDVTDILTQHNAYPIINTPYQDIDLHLLERRIKNHKFVENAQVYKDHSGVLQVEIKQCRPIARIVRTDGPHAYVINNGNTLNTSEKFTARVLIVDGKFGARLATPGFLLSETGKGYFDFLTMLDSDKFLKAQIAQISVNQQGNIYMYPLVGNEVFEIGKPDNLQEKIEKLKIFYKRILPQKGWNQYYTVNLKFKDQIICE